MLVRRGGRALQGQGQCWNTVSEGWRNKCLADGRCHAGALRRLFLGNFIRRELDSRQFDEESCSAHRGALDGDGSCVVGNDFAHDGKTKSRAIGLSRADKGIEQIVSYGKRNSRPVVRDADLERFRRGYDIESDFSMAVWDGLAGIQREVE